MSEENLNQEELELKDLSEDLTATEEIEESVTSEEDKILQEEKKKREYQDGVDRKIGKERKKRGDAERRAETLERENLELKQKINEVEKTRTGGSITDKKPKEEDFDDYKDYYEALSIYNTEIAINKKLGSIEKTVEELKTDKINAEAKIKEKEFLTVKIKGLKTFGDKFKELDKLEMNQSMYDAIMESDIPEKIFNHLLNNPEESLEISSLSRNSAIKKIGVIEDNVRKIKKTTNASEPVTVLSGGVNIVEGSLAEAALKSQPAFEKLYIKKHGEG